MRGWGRWGEASDDVVRVASVEKSIATDDSYDEDAFPQRYFPWFMRNVVVGGVQTRLLTALCFCAVVPDSRVLAALWQRA